MAQWKTAVSPLAMLTWCAALVITTVACHSLRSGTTCEENLNCPTASGGAAGQAGADGGSSTLTATAQGGAGGSGGTLGANTTSGGASTSSSTGAVGGTSSGGTPTGGSGGSSPLPCDGTCGEDTPACDEATDTCVECVGASDCDAGVCDTEEHTCVECLENGDCDDGVCHPDTNTCVECVDTPDCDNGVCNTEADLCVECLENSDCNEPSPHCDPEQQVCVECLETSDCSSPTKARCDAGSCAPCTSNADCTHLTGTTVCDIEGGTCVECTGLDYASCGELDGTPLVCQSLERTCTGNKQHSAGLCNECVSDAHCKPGQRCAREVFDGIELGYRCFWERGATEGGAPSACSSEPPYISAKVDATSIDGFTADLCTLRISTCKAHEQFSNVDCEVSENVPDPSVCGELDLNDAGCEILEVAGDDNIYRCTVRCSGNDDCREDHECDTSADPPVCFLNP